MNWWDRYDAAIVPYLVFLALGFFLSYIGVINSKNVASVGKFIAVCSGLYFASQATTPPTNTLLVEVFGRGAIFFIVYFFSLVLVGLTFPLFLRDEGETKEK